MGVTGIRVGVEEGVWVEVEIEEGVRGGGSDIFISKHPHTTSQDQYHLT